jgi:glycosyltransferase involved in cell wall biosynthesis
MLAVTGACLFIRKDLFQLLGGFDTVYKIGYYEDADICLRVRELGYKVIYEPDTMVVHKTGQTFKSLGGMKKLNFFVDNEAEFRRRWDNKIADNSFMFVTRHSYSPGKLNVAILNSYMETYGGGERLVTHVAKTLEDGNNVDILMRLVNRVNRGTILENTGIDLKNTDILTIMTGEPLRSVNKYDVFINSEWLSTEHGAGKKNILMTMFPNVTSNGTTGDGYINSYDSIITISKFSQHWIKRYWNKESTVIYPPVDFVCTDEERMSLRKENMILSVGRFFVGGHNKKHDVMIEAFKNLVDSGHNEWELHLVGGLKQNAADKDYFNKLIDLAGGYNVRFHTNASQREVHDLYKRSKVYWHATGYGASDPMSYEHFGIAPVEAISAGCVPVLINKGGLPEIVAECGGYLWNTISEVVGITSEISVNSKCTTVYPTVFSKDEFKKRISVAINDVVINDVVINDVVPNKVL